MIPSAPDFGTMAAAFNLLTDAMHKLCNSSQRSLEPILSCSHRRHLIKKAPR